MSANRCAAQPAEKDQIEILIRWGCLHMGEVLEKPLPCAALLRDCAAQALNEASGEGTHCPLRDSFLSCPVAPFFIFLVAAPLKMVFPKRVLFFQGH